MRILVVEDEPRIADDIRDSLVQAGYAVDIVHDGEKAWFQAEVENYDALILDLGLPRLDGLSVLRRLRAAGMSMPILILTARDSWRERVEGIDAGADDYLGKPFRLEELQARLRALLRRAVGIHQPVIKVRELELDTRTKSVARDGRALMLTPLEYRLLSYLMHHKNRAVAPTELLDHLYDEAAERDVNAIEAVLKRLRRKLPASFIETRRGQGYLVTDEPSNPNP